ncbi:CLIP domain-containing serine protease HP8-like [Hetaerina americana]|uniref:CLIP domain-containing serine protease HP8-like n=1 Tax=Hetaerina americana TaxID=62018 RepID=UPI003A7F59F1
MSRGSSPRGVDAETWPSEERAAEGWHGGNVSAHPHWRLLLTDKCGMAVTHRIFGGTEAQIGEYPWLALLEYHTKHGIQLLCGGALIGDRYVLTAAHCLEDTDIGRLSGVRLGEHDTETDPDCLEYGDEVVCGDPVQRRRIAGVTIHPNYRNHHGVVENDIGLVRLDRPALITGSRSHVKLWVGVPVVPNRICAPIYSHQITLRDDQMCAGGQEGRDSCMGDSGGPLMTVDDVVAGRRGGQWVAAGVVSFGPVLCASGGKPGIYTRVSPYVRWILDSLEP